MIAKSSISAAASALMCCATIAHRLGIFAAVVPLVGALTYAILVAEPIWQRLMTLVVLGLVPASMALMTGTLVGAILAMGSRVVDPIIALISRTHFVTRTCDLCRRLVLFAHRSDRDALCGQVHHPGCGRGLACLGGPVLGWLPTRAHHGGRVQRSDKPRGRHRG